MFNKFKNICAKLLLSASLIGLSAAPAAAFFSFSFGMDNNGPFMAFNEGGRFWHFNANHPFGRYGSIYNRGGYGGYNGGPWNSYYGARNRYFPNPYASRYPYSQYPYPQWPDGWSRAPAGYGMTPWGGFSPYGASPWGGSPFGGSPFGGLPFNGSPFSGSPFSGF